MTIGNMVFAALATVVAMLFSGSLLAMLTKRQDRRAVIWAVLAGAFMVLPVVSLYIAAQRWLVPLLDPNGRALWTLLSAPLLEEPAKWAVLLFSPMRRALRPGNAAILALAVGLGFACAEFWSQMASMAPADATTGAIYIARSITSPLMHGGFLLFFAVRLANGRPLWPAALAGIGLHLVVNTCALLTLVGIAPIWIVGWNVLRLAVIPLISLWLAGCLARAAGVDLRALMLQGRLERRTI